MKNQNESQKLTIVELTDAELEMVDGGKSKDTLSFGYKHQDEGWNLSADVTYDVQAEKGGFDLGFHTDF